MNVAPEVTFHGVDTNRAAIDIIRRKLDKLERICGHITSCRVAIEQPPHRRHTGNPYRVRIELTVPPGHDLVVSEESAPAGHGSEELAAAIRDAFEAARRRLQKLVQLQRGDVKSHPEQESVGVISRLLPGERYGFLRTPTGTEVYFHAHSVLNGGFADLKVGTAVRYVEEAGDEGPQASTVEIVG